jgi:hypothetical protein
MVSFEESISLLILQHDPVDKSFYIEMSVELGSK